MRAIPKQYFVAFRRGRYYKHKIGGPLGPGLLTLTHYIINPISRVLTRFCIFKLVKVYSRNLWPNKKYSRHVQCLIKGLLYLTSVLMEMADYPNKLIELIWIQNTGGTVFFFNWPSWLMKMELLIIGPKIHLLKRLEGFSFNLTMWSIYLDRNIPFPNEKSFPQHITSSFSSDQMDFLY